MAVFSSIVSFAGASLGLFVPVRLEILKRYVGKYYGYDLSYRQVKYIVSKLVNNGKLERRNWYEENKSGKLRKVSAFRITTYLKTK